MQEQDIIEVYSALQTNYQKKKYLNTLTNDQKDNLIMFLLQDKEQSQYKTKQQIRLQEINESQQKLEILKKQHEYLKQKIMNKKLEDEKLMQQQIQSVKLSGQNSTNSQLKQPLQEPPIQPINLQQNEIITQNPKMSSVLETYNDIQQSQQQQSQQIVKFMKQNMELIDIILQKQMSQKLISTNLIGKIKNLLKYSGIYLIKFKKVQTLKTGYLQFTALYKYAQNNIFSRLYGYGENQINITDINDFVMVQYKVQSTINLDIIEKDTILMSSRPQRLIENVVGFVE